MPNPIDDLGCTQAAVHKSGVGFAIFDQQDVAHSSTVEAVLPAAIVPSLVNQLGHGMGYSPYACCEWVPTSSAFSAGAYCHLARWYRSARYYPSRENVM